MARDTAHALSYPPKCKTSCHAQDVAAYFGASNRWNPSENWFTTSEPLPPPLADRSDMTWSSSWSQRGSSKCCIGTAIFCDLSMAWWKVEWDASVERRPDIGLCVKKQAKYLPRPASFPAMQLQQCAATYGEQVARFAEAAERARRPIAHGELVLRRQGEFEADPAFVQENAGIWQMKVSPACKDFQRQCPRLHAHTVI